MRVTTHGAARTSLMATHDDVAQAEQWLRRRIASSAAIGVAASLLAAAALVVAVASRLHQTDDPYRAGTDRALALVAPWFAVGFALVAAAALTLAWAGREGRRLLRRGGLRPAGVRVLGRIRAEPIDRSTAVSVGDDPDATYRPIGPGLGLGGPRCLVTGVGPHRFVWNGRRGHLLVGRRATTWSAVRVPLDMATADARWWATQRIVGSVGLGLIGGGALAALARQAGDDVDAVRTVLHVGLAVLAFRLRTGVIAAVLLHRRPLADAEVGRAGRDPWDRLGPGRQYVVFTDDEHVWSTRWGRRLRAGPGRATTADGARWRVVVPAHGRPVLLRRAWLPVTAGLWATIVRG